MSSTLGTILTMPQVRPPRLNLESFMGAQIKRGRQRHNLSLSVLARETSIPVEVLADYEAGTIRIPAPALIAIIEALDMTLSEMFDL